MGHGGREEEAAKVGPHQAQSKLGGGRPPFLLSLSLFLLLLLQLGKGGNLPLLGVGLSWRALLGRPPPPPLSLLYIRGQGHPRAHKLIF